MPASLSACLTSNTDLKVREWSHESGEENECRVSSTASLQFMYTNSPRVPQTVPQGVFSILPHPSHAVLFQASIPHHQSLYLA